MEFSFEKCLIKDGIVLSSAKTNKFKTSVLKLSIALPSSPDKMKTTLFGVMINVLRCGTEKYPEKSDIIKRLGDLYDASCSIGGYASGDNQIFEISAEMLSDRFAEKESILEGIIEIMCQLLFHPALDENGLFRTDTVEREKNVMRDKIKSEKNNSREYAFKRCREIICEGEPYGRSISTSDLDSVTPESLTAYYREFLSKSSISFSYVGDKNAKDVAWIIKKYFLDEPIGKADKLLPLNCSPVSSVKEISEELDIKQGVLILGFKSGILLGDRLSDSMRVFNNIFGGTSISRLFTTVREQMGLCYYCDSDYVSTKGLIFVSCGIDTSEKERAMSEILRQLEILRNTTVSDEELTAAKDMAIKELREMQDYPGAVASFRFANEIYGIDANISQKVVAITNVTPSDITEIAKNTVLNTVFFLKGTALEDNEHES